MSLCWLCLAFPVILMCQPPHLDPEYKRLQRLYFLSAQNSTYLPAFEDTLQILLRRYGPYPSLQMYRYGALALKARYTTNLMQKKDYLYTAIASMDAQVSRTPDDIEVRFLRGSFYYYLPFFLGKRKDARQDIETITRLLESRPTQLKEIYDREVLQAITEFITQTGWIEETRANRIRNLYN